MKGTVNSTMVLASEMHEMRSDAGRDYRITVALPLGYESEPGDSWPFHDVPESWPTVYVLDGNWYFGMMTDMIRPMSWCGGTSDAIVVGIGYPEAADPRDAFRTAFTRRNLDLTPTRDEAEELAMRARFAREAPSGGAETFHDFIGSELIPFIDGNYRSDPTRRCLIGHSYGGLFAAYSLFRSPSCFDSYVIGSPTLAYGERYVFRQEARYALENDDLRARVFVYAGDEESVDDSTLTDTIRFVARLQERQYDGLHLEKQLFTDHDHCAVAAPGMHAGLKFALGRR